MTFQVGGIKRRGVTGPPCAVCRTAIPGLGVVDAEGRGANASLWGGLIVGRRPGRRGTAMWIAAATGVAATSRAREKAWPRTT